MKTKTSIFFCAIGGSGMLPLAMLMKERGANVVGSDRAFDQKRTPERFAFIEKQGIKLFPQDGSGVTDEIQQLVVSTAVEPTVPDYATAREKNIPVIHRAALLASLFNQAKVRIAIAGTSGKSTTTGMIGWMLTQAHLHPTIVNGAVMKNFKSANVPFASSVVGDPDLFVAEVDESDGSIEHFIPTVAVLNNIALDHKSMDDLRALFRTFIGKADHIVLNLDNPETAVLAVEAPKNKTITYSQINKKATLFAANLAFRPTGVSFDVFYGDQKARAILHVPGAHNVSNALAAIGAAVAVGIDLRTAVDSFSSFSGIARRMDVIGTAHDITVIDDFAHNPDKIAATLRSLHQFKGRLLILFQPHGFGPLRLMRKEFVDCFRTHLKHEDRLYMCDPLYLGGTTDRSITSANLVDEMQKKNCYAFYKALREDCAAAILQEAREGDRILIMGARDDTLPVLAQDILNRLKTKEIQ